MLNDDIILYCELNSIDDTEAFIQECIVIGFNIKKYGNSPFITTKQDAKMVIKDNILPTKKPTKNEDDYELYNT